MPDWVEMEKHIAQNIQDAFLKTARRDKATIILNLMNGETLSGRIKSFDKFSVMLDIDGSEVLVFKHSISTITTEKKKSNFG